MENLGGLVAILACTIGMALMIWAMRRSQGQSLGSIQMSAKAPETKLALAGLLALEAANLAVLLAPMGCGPASPFGKLF